MTASVAYQIVKDLWKLNRNFSSSDYDASLAYLSQILRFDTHAFPAKEHLNGWVIPPKWDLKSAVIRYQGQLIFAAQHPLQVIGLSAPFRGVVSREELVKHLHYDRRDPQATPYHFRQNYRPWERDWGFCVTKEFYDALPEGNYEVEIVTEESADALKVLSYTKAGTHPETFTFVAHLDHPGMANDDLAGVAVGVDLFTRLSDRPTKYTYQLVLVQEMIGSAFYLGKLPNLREHLLESCFLEMLGSETEFALQNSYKGETLLEATLGRLLQNRPHRVGPFRSIICNDEPVWESYGIPMASLSRFPYPEYHSDKDNLSIISRDALEDAIQLLELLVDELDQATLVRKKFEGVPALSNPSYDLYVDPGQPAFGTVGDEQNKRLRLLMDLMPLYPKKRFVEQMAVDVGLSREDALAYLRRWAQKGLVELI